ncbi:MAG TPA: response regulator, partial [Cyclobacteriaceae bacterium]|nr:response regulator [Cyclobacteriaceae bacterium]
MDFRGFSEHFPAKILLVEDNEINRKFMSIVFTQMGYQPDIAKNGQEAIDMVLQKSYDIIFMDHQMPKMNGAEATKAIRGLENGPAIKIIGLSANVLDKDADDQYREGKDGHLAKPVKIEDIAETIRSCFESMGN